MKLIFQQPQRREFHIPIYRFNSFIQFAFLQFFIEFRRRHAGAFFELGNPLFCASDAVLLGFQLVANRHFHQRLDRFFSGRFDHNFL